MKPKTLHAAMAGGLLLTATASLAGQQLVCDREPTSSTSASCFLQSAPERVSAPMSPPASATFYVVEPASVQVREHIIATPVVATPVQPLMVTYYVDEPYPDPSPALRPVETRVYVPAERRGIESAPSMPRGNGSIMPD